MPPSQRDIDEQNHVLGKKCRACSTFVIDDYPGILYIVDYTNSPQNPPQLIDLLVYHSPQLPNVFPPKANVTEDRPCAKMVGVDISGLLAKNLKGRKLGFAQIDAADLSKTFMFLQTHFGPYTNWSVEAKQTVKYLQPDMKLNLYLPGKNDYSKAIDIKSRVLHTPGAIPNAVSSSPSKMITHLAEFQDQVLVHNNRYTGLGEEDIQQMVFAPAVIPASKSGSCILILSYMQYKPKPYERPKALFGYYYYEFPNSIAEYVLQYGESYIGAARALQEVSMTWNPSWKDPEILKFLNEKLKQIQPTVLVLRALSAYLKNSQVQLQALSTTDIQRKICTQLALPPSAFFSAAL